MVNLSPTSTPRSFSAKLLSSSWEYLEGGCFVPTAQLEARQQLLSTESGSETTQGDTVLSAEPVPTPCSSAGSFQHRAFLPTKNQLLFHQIHQKHVACVASAPHSPQHEAGPAQSLQVAWAGHCPITGTSLTRGLLLIYSKKSSPRTEAGLGAAPGTYSFLLLFSLLRCHVLYFRRRLQYSMELGSSSSRFLGGPRWILKSLWANTEDEAKGGRANGQAGDRAIEACDWDTRILTLHRHSAPCSSPRRGLWALEQQLSFSQSSSVSLTPVCASRVQLHKGEARRAGSTYQSGYSESGFRATSGPSLK